MAGLRSVTTRLFKYKSVSSGLGAMQVSGSSKLGELKAQTVLVPAAAPVVIHAWAVNGGVWETQTPDKWIL